MRFRHLVRWVGARGREEGPRWLRRILAGAVAVVCVLAAVASFMALAPWPAREVHAPRNVAGVFHVHAEASHDGFGTLDEAVAAAASIGARFLILTEHNALRPAAPERREGVLVVPGMEISSAHGHVVAVGLSRDPQDKSATVLESIRRAGGAAILAHPVNRKRPWDDPSVRGFAGFEALSLDSAFREALASGWGRLGLAGVALLGDRRKVGALVMDRPADALARYDAIVAARDGEPLAMACGTDAHGLPPYVASFGALALHVDVGAAGLSAWGTDDQADAAAVVRAIRRGATFCSVPALGDAAAFSFRLVGGEVEAFVPREDVVIVLYRDGEEAFRGEGPRLAAPTLPGAWRAEVYLDAGFPHGGERLWIATSALRVAAAAPD